MTTAKRLSNRIRRSVRLAALGLACSVIAFGAVGSAQAATHWVSNPSACPQTDAVNFPGQNCTPQNMCGDSSGIAQCYNTSGMSAPAGSILSSTQYSASYGGGYVVNCFAVSDGASPFCDNGGSAWCNSDASCFGGGNNRQTTCTAGTWASAGAGAFSCGACLATHLDCGGDTKCEVQKNVTDYPTGGNNHYGNTCDAPDARCDSGYYDCNASGVTVGDGCEASRSGACTTSGGLSGTWSCTANAGGACSDGGQNYDCSCDAPKCPFRSAELCAYASTEALLWGRQYGTGNLITMGNATRTDAFVVRNDGSVQLATTTAPTNSTNLLYNLNGDLYWNGTLVGAGATSSGQTLQEVTNLGNTTTRAIQFAGGTSTGTFVVNGRVGIGANYPQAKLHVVESGAGDKQLIRLQDGGDVDHRLYVPDGSNQLVWDFNAGGAGGDIDIQNDGDQIAHFTSNGLVVNEGGLANIGFRVEAQGSANAFFVDPATSRVGIGTNVPDSTLTMVATGTNPVTMRLSNYGIANFLLTAADGYNTMEIDPVGDGNQFVITDEGLTALNVWGTDVGIGTSTVAGFVLGVGGHAGPSINGSFDLGSQSKMWRNLYSSGFVSTTALYVNGVLVPTSTGSLQAAYDAGRTINTADGSNPVEIINPGTDQWESSLLLTNANNNGGIALQTMDASGDWGGRMYLTDNTADPENSTGGYLVTENTAQAFEFGYQTAGTRNSSFYIDYNQMALNVPGSASQGAFAVRASNYNVPILTLAAPTNMNFIQMSVGTSTPEGRVAGYSGSLFHRTDGIDGNQQLYVKTTDGGSNGWMAIGVAPTSSNAFVQGGNSFGAAGILGTNDNQRLFFETNNTPAMIITETGLVGVGTAVGVPSHDFEIAGALGFAFMDGTGDPLMEVNGSINNGTAMLKFGDFAGVDTETAFYVNPPSSTAYFMNGNFGVGTESPSEQLTITGDMLIGQYDSIIVPMAGQSRRMVIRATDSALPGNQGTAYVGYQRNGVDLAQIGLNTANDIAFMHNNGSWRTDMVIDQNGYVGIGVASPLWRLHAANDGSVMAGFTNSSTSEGLIFVNDNLGDEIGMSDVRSDGIIAAVSKADSSLFYYGNRVLNVVARGGGINDRVGVGTVDPYSKLHVEGDIYMASTTPATTTYSLYNLAGALYWNGSPIMTGSASTGNAFLQGGNAFGTTARLGTTDPQHLEIMTNSTTRLWIDATSGNLGVGTAPDSNAPLAVLGHSRYLMTLFTDEVATNHAEWFIGYGASDQNSVSFDFNREGGAGSTQNFVSMHMYGDVAGEGLSVHDQGRIGIGTLSSAVTSSAKLQIDSTSMGVLLPRMNLAQRDAIVSPATGLVLYNTVSSTFDYFDGLRWVSMATGTGSGSALTLQQVTDNGNATTRSIQFAGGTSTGDLSVERAVTAANLTVGSASDDAFLTLRGNGGASSLRMSSNNGGNWAAIEAAANGSFNLTADGNMVAWADGPTGFLGVGGVSPASRLHVVSGAASTTPILTLQNNSGDFQTFNVSANPQGSVVASPGDMAVDSQNGLMYIKQTGLATNTGWVPVATGTGVTQHWLKSANVLSPADAGVHQLSVTNNSASTLTGFKAVNTNDASNYAGAVIEMKGSGADFTNNVYFGKYGSSFWIPSWAGNGVLATDKDLVLGAVGTGSLMRFQVGGGYSAPATVATMDADGFDLQSGVNLNVASNAVVQGLTSSTRGLFVNATGTNLYVTRQFMLGQFVVNPTSGQRSGAMVYNSASSTPFFWDGARWVAFATGSNPGVNAFVQNGNSFGALATLGTKDANALRFMTSGTEAIRILANGNVGIGVANPTRQLDIAKSINLSNTTSNDTGIIFKNGIRFIHNFQHPVGGSAVPSGDNLFIGTNSGNFTMGSTATEVYHASHNIAIGDSTLNTNTIGYQNVAIGQSVLDGNTTGYNNAAIGPYALRYNTVGYQNTAVGPNVLFNNISGHSNVGISSNALNGNTTGYRNVAIGYAALYSNTVGYDNTAIGSNAGRYLADGLSNNSTSSRSVFIGPGTKAASADDTNEIVIGYNAVGIGSNTAVIGNDSIVSTQLKGNVGLGTSTPAFRLDVVGDARVSAQLMLGRYAMLPVAGAQAGAMVYSTASSTPFFWDGARWVAFATGSGALAEVDTLQTVTDRGNVTNNGIQFAGGTSTGGIYPSVTNSISLGASSTRWSDVWTANLHLGTSTWDFSQAANGAFSLNNGSLNAFDILTNGNIGIGTTDPSQRLHVIGTAAFMNGMVGIGTVTPSAMLDIRDTRAGIKEVLRISNGGSSENLFHYASGSSVLVWETNNSYADASDLEIKNAGTSLAYFGATGLIINKDGSSAVDFRVAGVSDPAALTVDASVGYVGFGTSTPAYRLDVLGDARIGAQLMLGRYATNPATGLQSGSMVYNTVSSTPFFWNGSRWIAFATSTDSGPANAFVQNGNSFAATGTLGTNDSRALAFETSSTNRMVIMPNGNVGINNFYPSSRIDAWDLVTDPTAGIRSYRFNTQFNAINGDVDQVEDGLNFMTLAGTKSGSPHDHLGSVRAMTGAAYNTGAGNVDRMNGMTFAGGALGSGNINYYDAIIVGVYGPSGTGRINQATGLNIANMNAYNTPTTTYGIRMNSNVSSTGVNKYGIYLGNISGASADNFAIYTNDGVSHFGDRVGIETENTNDFALQVAGDVGPDTNLTYDLGSASKRWNNAWVGTMHIGTSTWDLAQSANGALTFGRNGGSEQVRFTSNGRVGVGTNNPDTRLHLVNSTGDEDYITMTGNNIGNFRLGYNGANSLIDYNNADDTTGLQFRSYNQSVAQLNAGGAFSLGTTIANNLFNAHSNNYRVAWLGSSSDGDNGASVSLMRSMGEKTAPEYVPAGVNLGNIYFGGYDRGGSWSKPSADISANATEDFNGTWGTDMRFSVVANGGVDLVESMRIDQNGNVGIGSTVPNAKLELSGDNSSIDVPLLRFEASNNSDIQSQIYFSAGGNGTYWNVNSSGNGGALILRDGATEISRFVNNGLVVNEGGAANVDFRVEGDTDANALFVDATNNNVGIGTNLPATSLELRRDTTSANYITMSNANSGIVGLEFRGTTADVTRERMRMQVQEFGRTTFAMDDGESNYNDVMDISYGGGVKALRGDDDILSAWSGLAGQKYFTVNYSGKVHIDSTDNATGLVIRDYNSGLPNGAASMRLAARGGSATDSNLDIGISQADDIVHDTYIFATQPATNGGGTFRIGTGSNGGDLVFYTNNAARLSIAQAGNVGIGDTTPDAKLDVEIAGTVAIFNRLTSDGTLIDLQRAGASVGTISVAAGVVSYNAFSGSHYAWTDQTIEAGDIVTLTGNNRRQHDSQNSEIIYGIALATSTNDPRILGAYVGLLNPSEAPSEANPHLVNAVGNGDIWVADKGQNVAVGDYLVSSDVAGHAMKDDGANAVSHVFARAAEPVDWTQVTTTFNGVKHVKISVFYESFARTNAIASVQSAATGNVLQGAVNGPYVGDLIVTTSTFSGTVTVLGHMELSKDSVGQAEVLVGATRVHVAFDRAYDSLPIVTVTPHGTRRMDYGVENVSLTGFDIVLDPIQYRDVLFDWHAFGEREAKVFVSNGTTLEIELTDMGTSKLETQINAQAQPMPEVTPTQSTSSEPVAETEQSVESSTGTIGILPETETGTSTTP